jgi:hypothetical protein
MVAQDNDRAGPWRRIVRREDRAAEQRFGAQDTEVIAGNKIRGRKEGWGIRISATVGGEAQRHLVRKTAIGRDPLKRPRIRFKLAREIPREIAAKLTKIDASRNSGGFGVTECNQLLGIAHRQLVQKNLVDQCKDRSVGSNTQGEGNQGDGGISGTLEQGSETDPQIRENALQRRLPARRPDLVLDCVAAAHFGEGRLARSACGQSAFELVFDRSGQKALKLLVQLTFQSPFLKERFDPRRHVCQPAHIVREPPRLFVPGIEISGFENACDGADL